MLIKHCLYFFLSCFVFSNISNAQTPMAHEVGIFIGPSILQSDYGQRNDFSSNYKNTGFGIGLVHYLNFSYNSENTPYFNYHFKVRSEASYTNTTLNQTSDWIKNYPNSKIHNN